MEKAIALLVLLAGCTALPEESSTRSSVTGVNGLTTNGIWENGIWENGIWENGIWDNGIWENGIWDNGIWENGIWENGIWENGIWENGIWENGIWENGISADGAPVTNWRAEQLKTNPYSRQLLQYIYSCAMPATIGGQSTATMIGPDEARVELVGSVGLAINEDNTAAWETGRCDQSCQRWISACVLARTNAYGVSVRISMRAPETAPPRVKDALAVSDDERGEFGLREGAFFGNIFQVEPDAASPELMVSKPELFACAGPGSNVPEVTKRFCSSQGDNSVIKVSNVCTASPGRAGACTDIGANEAVYNCQSAGNPKIYPEVITVFIRDLIAVCGNAVCEDSELDSCPSDCHPETWVRSYPTHIGLNASAHNIFLLNSPKLAWASPDETVVIAGNTNQDIDLGSGVMPRLSFALDLVVAKYTETGVPVWSRRFANQYTTLMVVGRNSDIYVQTHVYDDPSTVGGPPDPIDQLLRLDPSGNVVATWKIGGAHTMVVDAAGNVIRTEGATITKYPGSATLPPPAWATTLPADWFQMSLAVDSDGNVLVASKSQRGEGFSRIVKLRATDGVELWRKEYPQDRVYPQGIAAGADNDVYVTGAVRWDYDLGGGIVHQPAQLGYFLVKYDGATGDFVWDQRCKPRVSCAAAGQRIGFDAAGNVIVSGLMGALNQPLRIDFGVGTWNAYATPDVFVASYASADTLPADQRRLRWAKQLPAVLDGNFFGVDITASGRIVTAGLFSGSLSLDDRLLISRQPESQGVFDTFVGSFVLPSATDVTPPVIDVAHMPKSITVQATAPSGTEVFFMPPTATDAGFAGTSVSCSPSSFSMFPIGTTTVTCIASDPVGNASQATFVVTVVDTRAPLLVSGPGDMTVVATSPSGAAVTYVSPTFKDQADAALAVNCVPASGSVFPIGLTNVVCFATDDHGNVAEHHFSVTVTDPGFDDTPPAVTVPGTITVEALGPGGASVSFSASAVDATDGDVAVTCSRVSGSTFALGTTEVTCTASDTANNTGSATFTVVVQDTTAPAVMVPGSIVATATSANGVTVTYATSAHDVVDGTIVPACTIASGALFPVAVTTVTCSATDAHGNTASASFTVDVAPPPTITTPSAAVTASATSASGAVVTYAVSAADSTGAGVTATCSPPSGSTFPVGNTTVTCTATDSDGRIANATFTVTVTAPQQSFDWSGVLQPVNADGSSIFKLGKTVPVKFALTGSSAGVTNLVAHLSIAKISDGIEGTVLEATSTSAADAGNQFRYDATDGQYIFNLGTSNLSTGTWVLKLDFHDGVSRSVHISLKN